MSRLACPSSLPFGCVSLAALMLSAAASAAGPFVEEGAARGIGAYQQAPPMGSGVAVADADGDGDSDMFVPTVEGMADQFYINQGNGMFVESAAQQGLADTRRARAALWFDMDGDADLDLVVGGDCFGEWATQPGDVPCSPGRAFQRLYRQDDGQFVDVTVASGLTQDSGLFRNHDHRGGYAAADVDGDGDLDLYAAQWFGPSRFYRNLGNGQFADATASAGMALPEALAQWQPVFADFNADGHPDLFVAVDFAPNLLFMNDGDGTFTERAVAAGVATAWNEMGVALGDFDGDLDPDLYVTNVWQRVAGEHNVLFRNLSTPANVQFDNPAMALGVGNCSWGWGTTFLDADRDGDLDLAATNGFSESDGPQYPTDASCYFRNDGNIFTEMAAAAGLDDRLWGSSLVTADLDQDGRPDLVQTTKVHPAPGPLRLVMNRTPGDAGWVRVIPRQVDGNTQAIGARVIVQAGAPPQVRFIQAGGSFLGQEPAEALFGLGAAARVDFVRVIWPDGRATERLDWPARQTIRIQDDELLVAGFD